MTDALAVRLVQQAARDNARVAAEAKAAEVAAVSAAAVATKATRHLPDEVAAYLRANPPRPGRDGSPGFLWRGSWSRVETYGPPDVVEFNGSVYLATGTSTGSQPPSSDWDLMVKSGADGKNGQLAGWRGGGGGIALIPGGPALNVLEFTGTGVTTSQTGAVATVTISGGGGGGGAVSSVNTQTGAVVLAASDVGADASGAAAAALVTAEAYTDTSVAGLMTQSQVLARGLGA